MVTANTEKSEMKELEKDLMKSVKDLLSLKSGKLNKSSAHVIIGNIFINPDRTIESLSKYIEIVEYAIEHGRITRPEVNRILGYCISQSNSLSPIRFGMLAAEIGGKHSYILSNEGLARGYIERAKLSIDILTNYEKEKLRKTNLGNGVYIEN